MFVPCSLQKTEKIHIFSPSFRIFTPSVSMFIGQGLSLEALHAAQAERLAANTATAATSAAAAAAADSDNTPTLPRMWQSEPPVPPMWQQVQDHASSASTDSMTECNLS